MRVVFDTNVVLDVLSAREPHAAAAAGLFWLVDAGELEGVVVSTTVTTIHYLVSKDVGRRLAEKHVRDLLAMFDVACVERETFEKVLSLGFVDFEDAVLHEAARAAGAAAIVTRDGKGFAGATLPIFDPGELLAALVAASE